MQGNVILVMRHSCMCNTLPKLPFPSTCKKLKSSRPTLTVSSSCSSNAGGMLLMEFWAFIPVMCRELYGEKIRRNVLNVHKFGEISHKDNKCAYNQSKYYWYSRWLLWRYLRLSFGECVEQSNLWQFAGQFRTVHSAVGCNILFTAFVDVHLATWTNSHHTDDNNNLWLQSSRVQMYSNKSSKYVLTLAMETLFHQAVQERSAVVTVCGNFVVVFSKLVG